MQYGIHASGTIVVIHESTLIDGKLHHSWSTPHNPLYKLKDDGTNLRNRVWPLRPFSPTNTAVGTNGAIYYHNGVSESGHYLFGYNKGAGPNFYVNDDGSVPGTLLKLHKLPWQFIRARLKLADEYCAIFDSDWTPLFHRRGVYIVDGKPASMADFVQSRIRQRIEAKEYLPVHKKFPHKPEHGVHLSTQNPKLLAHYPDKRHVDADRFQQIKPGRYLRQYFPELSGDEVRILSSYVTGAGCRLELISDWRQMAKAYKDLRSVVESCMSSSNWKEEAHPFQVYHNSDVQLAVLYDEGGDPVARAMVNKHTKQYGMIYGQWERMQGVLADAGYTHGSLIGAQINRINHPTIRGAILMPYIDGARVIGDRSYHNAAYIQVHDDYCEIVADGPICASNTCGYHEIDDREVFTCDHCGDDFDEDDRCTTHDEADLCESCYDEHSTNVIWNADGYTVRRYDLSDHLEINGTYYRNERVADDLGWRYSCHHEERIHLSNAAWIEDKSDWFHRDDDDIVLIGDLWYTIDGAIETLYYDGCTDTIDNFNTNNTSVPLEDLKAHYSECPPGVPGVIWNELPECAPDPNPLPARLNPTMSIPDVA